MTHSPDSYTLEAVDKCTKRQQNAQLLFGSETLTERERLLSETAYRRGFCQGWYFCLKAFQDGSTARTLESFLNSTLMRWRLTKHGGKLMRPPVDKLK